jgi:rare lipoprotein A
MGRGEKRADFCRVVRVGAVTLGCLALANCSSGKFAKLDPKYGVSSSPRIVQDGEPVPKGGGSYRVGKPYVVAGRTYVPEENINYRSEGTASWYGDDFHGRLTANGEIFDMHSISAAHPTLPLPSYVRVTNLSNRKSIVVRVNDRGPYAGNRVIDVSVKTAQLLGFHENGLAQVRVEYVGQAPLAGSDDRQLVATLSQGNPAPAPSGVRVASARPFLPEEGDPGRSDRRAVPVPAERPFTLGQTVAKAPEQPTSSDFTAAAKPVSSHGGRIEAAALPPLPAAKPVVAAKPVAAPAVKSAAAPALAPAAGTLGTLSVSAASPISAFAPTRYDGAAGFSGRGLY